ncbi:MAG: hypothetical protein U1F61_24510 [Opitutaceae bacterium]
MATILKVELKLPPGEFLSEFRNFGEAVYLDLRHECSVSIQEIDAATHVFHVRDLRAKFVRTAAARVRKIALKHKMAGMIDVVEIPA